MVAETPIKKSVVEETPIPAPRPVSSVSDKKNTMTGRKLSLEDD